MLRLMRIAPVLLAVVPVLGPAGPVAAQATKRDKPAVNTPTGSPATSSIHEQMAKRAGQWTLNKKLTYPGRPPVEATATARITSILGGRFLREENEGMLFGRPVAAEMLSGYNDEAEKYEVVWAWTGANRLITATGTSADGGKTIHFTSSYDSGKGRKEQIVIDMRVIDDDHFVVNLVSKMPDGTDGPAVETTYSRKN